MYCTEVFQKEWVKIALAIFVIQIAVIITNNKPNYRIT